MVAGNVTLALKKHAEVFNVALIARITKIYIGKFANKFNFQGRSEGGGGSWGARDPHFVSPLIFRGENAMAIMFDTV